LIEQKNASDEYNFGKSKEEEIYEIILDGNNTYYADGYVAHNK